MEDNEFSRIKEDKSLSFKKVKTKKLHKEKKYKNNSKLFHIIYIFIFSTIALLIILFIIIYNSKTKSNIMKKIVIKENMILILTMMNMIQKLLLIKSKEIQECKYRWMTQNLLTE